MGGYPRTQLGSKGENDLTQKRAGWLGAGAVHGYQRLIIHLDAYF